MAWLIWAVTTAGLCAALTGCVRRVNWPTIIRHLPPPMQGLAAAVVGAAAITTTVAAPAAATITAAPTAPDFEAHRPTPPAPDTHTIAGAGPRRRPVAVDLIMPATRVDPLNPDLQRRAEAILHATGDHEAAQALHQAFQQRLAAAGLAPSDTPFATPGEER